MHIWDDKDVAIVAQAIKAVAPADTVEAAKMIMAAAAECCIDRIDFSKAIAQSMFPSAFE